MNQKLTTSDHDRDVAGLRYVYPVISRRAGGLSIGINFNINNACNWRCVYCQVPNLVRGTAPDLDFLLLEKELRFFLEHVVRGNFYNQFNVPEQQRVIKDIAISGNGEPTSLKDFDKAVKLIGDIATELQVLPYCDFVLITNGSLLHQSRIQKGLKVLNEFDGEVWFKLDSATDEGRVQINDCKQSTEKTLENLETASALCETSLQTCMLDYLEVNKAEDEKKAYFELLKTIKQRRIKIKKILLYSLARPSLQPEAEKIHKINAEKMNLFSRKLRTLGYDVSISS
jgi:wyosine [tRNA(Phe)-imidazoG37] synthetase (radical SAM superfamily)